MCRLIASLFGVLLLTSEVAHAQFGRRIQVQAGTPEDKALSEIRAATDPRQKLALIEQFARAHPEGDLALLADQLFVETYAALKDYDQVFLYGDRVLAADPDNLAVAVALVAAAQEKGDLDRLVRYSEQVGQAVQRVRHQAPPAGTPAEEWEREKAEALAQARPNIEYVEGIFYQAAERQSVPAQRIALLTRFLEAFPDSRYAAAAEYEVAASYQHAGQTQQMLAFARKRVAQDPTDVPMRLLLADTLSDQAQQLDEAEAMAKQVLDLLAHAQKPAEVSDADWQRQVNLQKGLAYSALGEIYIRRNQDSQAVAAFQQAKPLLQPDRINYARNLYRLGFTLARMKRTAEARAVLQEVVSLDTPYRALAQEVLRKLAARPARP